MWGTLRKLTLSLALLIALALAAAPVCLAAEIRVPEPGEAAVGGPGDVFPDGGWSLETDFWLHVAGSVKPYEDGPVRGGNLPKTGDAGLDINTVLYIALASGALYLLCAECGGRSTDA